MRRRNGIIRILIIIILSRIDYQCEIMIRRNKKTRRLPTANNVDVPTRIKYIVSGRGESADGTDQT